MDWRCPLSDSNDRKKAQLFTLRVKVPAKTARHETPTQFPFEAQITAKNEQAARAELQKIFGKLPYELEPAEGPIPVEDLPMRLASKMAEGGVVRLRAIEPVSSIEEGIARTGRTLTGATA